MQIFDELKTRGVKDVLFISMDGVSGLEEGVKAIALGCDTFYTGAMGEFDSLFSSAVRKDKQSCPDLKLICVKPYMNKEINKNSYF